MEIQNSHDIYSSSETGDFFLFYTRVIGSTQFYRIAKSESEQFIKSTNLKKNNIIYDSTSVIKKKDTYDKSEQVIIYSNSHLEGFFSDIYVVQDPIDTHRYFVGMLLQGNYTSVKIHGLFIYFDSKGSLTEKIIIPKIVMDYDYRNGRVDFSNTYLYNQSLVFLTSHRDTHKYQLNICCFDYYDNLIGTHNTCTEISSDYFFEKKNLQSNRWLILPDVKTNEKWILDLGSICVEKNESGGKTYIYSKFNINLKMNYLMYKCDDNYQISSIISTDYSKPAKPYYDEYMSKCAKCKNLTSIAYYYEGNMSIGLGKSYCHDCGIRYSLSDKIWTCCKLKPKNDSDLHYNFCNEKLDEENSFTCNKLHSDKELIFNFDLVEKKPYKKNGSVTIK